MVEKTREHQELSAIFYKAKFAQKRQVVEKQIAILEERTKSIDCWGGSIKDKRRCEELRKLQKCNANIFSVEYRAEEAMLHKNNYEDYYKRELD